MIAILHTAMSCVVSALNCLTLVPVPAYTAVSGDVMLRPVSVPFGVAVTVDGRPRYHLVASITGLPDPRAIGPYRAYVAWAYTITLDSVVKLGRVTNGRNDLGEIAIPQFRLFVTAERSAGGSARHGRLILRGTSPSARLAAHRDLLQSQTALGGMAGMGAMTHIPLFRPGAVLDVATIPRAQPRAIVHLADGDTFDLDAKIVRRTIVGKTLTMYGFNGQDAGPLLEVRQGASITVRSRNELDQPTSVHWHGVRVDSRFDGAAGVSQEPVPPGGTFTYTVRFPDAGIYWYHSHVREDIQQNLGLVGNILVRAPTPGYYGAVNREEAVIVNDLLLDDAGTAPYGATAPTHALMGRFGNVFLVNGEPRYTLAARRGEVVRFFVTNASNARVYNLSFARARMKVVGSDLGRFEREALVQSIAIAPAERYVVEVEFNTSGPVALVNRVIAFDHMTGRSWEAIDTLGVVQVSHDPTPVRYTAEFGELRRHVEMTHELARFRAAFAAPPSRTLVLSLRTQALPLAISRMLQGVNAAVEWNDGMPAMNAATTGKEITWVLRDSATGRENMDIGWRFHQGDVVKLRIVNDPSASHAMDHAIHVHGQRFLVVSRDGVPNRYPVWKDTVLVPAGETVDLLLDMSNPGRWMLQCHIAEHLGAGMMTTFTVEP